MMICCFSCLKLWFDDFWVCWKSSLKDSSSMENEFITLDLEPQNRFSHTQDIGWLNSFENMLTNKIV